MKGRDTRSRWRIDARGLLPAGRYLPSPNRDARPPGAKIELVVLHNISLPPGEFGGDGILELFANRLDPRAHPYYETICQLRVSAHFLIRRDGELVQFVPCGERAWHAGVSSWRGRERCNDFSVGIEIEGSDDTPFDERQYTVLNRLLPALRESYPIVGVAGHSEIAPGRKTDPGPFFDWRRVGREAPLPDPSAL
jgi:AmpD protein